MATPNTPNAPNNPTKVGPPVTKAEAESTKERTGLPSKKRPVTELIINKKSIVKLELPDNVDVDKEWKKFLEDHSHVSSKEALPTAFVGDLVNKHKAIQVSSAETPDRVSELSF